MADKSVGEDVVWFADYHFPPPPPSSISSSRKTTKKNPFETLKGADLLGERELTRRFIHAVNEHKLAPGLKMAYCGDRPDPSACDDDGQKPDAAFYRMAVASNDEKPHWGDQLIACEFKVAKSGGVIQDPFEDVPNTVDGVVPSASEHRKKNRGQIITYAELLFAVQQRIAVFTLLVLGRQCRFIRWDRSGLVVTRSFDYYKKWKFFVDVLWRISQSSDKRLGLDPTAHRLFPGDPDYRLMTEAAKSSTSDVDHKERYLRDNEVPQGSFVFSYVRKAFEDSVTDTRWPRYRVEVPDGKQMRSFLIGKPRFCAKGLAGRGTRGYVALECGTGRFVWLKDAWRAHYLLVDREGDILERLTQANVPYIPTLVCHGDIDDQVTYTPQRWEEKHPVPSSKIPGSSFSTVQKRKLNPDEGEGDVPPPKGLTRLPLRSDSPLRRHKHYRLVVKEVALPLSEFQFGRQLVSVVKDCVIAHYYAYTELLLLHRDISSGNVLIDPRLGKTSDGRFKVEYTGILADWEMAKETTVLDPRQPERTGTWQYMSVALLSGDKAVEVCDELESFFYVLLYNATRYLLSRLPDITIANYLDEFFDQYGWGDGRYVCGDKKKITITTGELEVAHTVKLKFNSNMDDVLADLLSWFKAHHVVSRYEIDNMHREASRSAMATGQPPAGDRKSRAPVREIIRTRALPRVALPGRGSTQRDGPSKEDREKAPLASSHAAVVTLLEEAERTLGWSMGDKAGDRIPKTWRPDKKYDHEGSTHISAAGTSNKKRRTTNTRESLPLSLTQQRPPKTPPPPPPTGPSTALERSCPSLEPKLS
ncbi:hypothetical protein K466DRAFT_632764 [Polyporus arcularius HHB13444]|uniref:Fungal-type protein kinase domain-containing protein n=1 Tax=Polyporus arcularius HHB13444 TaxID=1314778 RepID=A0A5C3PNV1_9APHY|nr:hypothetical protein K466DRAFT_632764 [Polyporus arcularius HHB13444]